MTYKDMMINHNHKGFTFIEIIIVIAIIDILAVIVVPCYMEYVKK